MERPPIRIRPCLPDERETIEREIVHPAWLSGFRHILPTEAMEASFRGDLEVSCDYWTQRLGRLASFVAEIDGRRAGTVGLGEYAGGEGEVRALHVAPEFQGRKVGMALWEHAESFFAALGSPAVNVWTLAGANSCRFYEAMGCEPVGTGTLFLGEHSAVCVHYRKALDT